MVTVALQPKLVLSIYRSMKLVRDLLLVAMPMLCLLYNYIINNYIYYVYDKVLFHV